MKKNSTDINNVMVQEKIDELEAAMLTNLTPVECPLTHKFTPGMYIREIFMPAGTMVTSLVHNTTHPFFVLKGKVSVYSSNDGLQLLEAPYIGITTPGTRRVLYIHEDCVWATCHPVAEITGAENDLSEDEKMKVVEMVADKILTPHENTVLGATVKNNQIINSNKISLQ